MNDARAMRQLLVRMEGDAGPTAAGRGRVDAATIIARPGVCRLGYPEAYVSRRDGEMIVGHGRHVVGLVASADAIQAQTILPADSG